MDNRTESVKDANQINGETLPGFVSKLIIDHLANPSVELADALNKYNEPSTSNSASSAHGQGKIRQLLNVSGLES